MTYNDFPEEASPQMEKYMKLVEQLGNRGPLLSAKRIGMGKTTGTLLFLEYKTGDASGSVSVSAFSEAEPDRYTLIIEKVPVYLGEYRMYKGVNYHLLFLDSDSDGEVEIFVFSDEVHGNNAKPGFHLDWIYVYDKKLGRYRDHYHQEQTPEEQFDPKDFSSGIW